MTHVSLLTPEPTYVSHRSNLNLKSLDRFLTETSYIVMSKIDLNFADF